MKSSFPWLGLALSSCALFGMGACQSGLQAGEAGSLNDDGESGGTKAHSGGTKGEGSGGRSGNGSGGVAAAGGSQSGGSTSDGGAGGEESSGGNATGGASSGGASGDGGTGGGVSVCEPGSPRDCYEGDPDTEGVGPCHAGTETCLPDGSGYGPCTDQVVPTAEICGNEVDDDCDERVDFGDDADGDGWALCLGDCCDDEDGCDDPASVNVGAFEIASNEVDDDCDGSVDVVSDPCDSGLVSNSTSALDFARALDLCQTTTASPSTPEARTWGVLSARFALSSGTGSPSTASRAIRTRFGTSNLPQRGSSLVVLSTGTAAAPDQTNPAHAAFEDGYETALTSTPPSDWLSLNGNTLPTVSGCPSPQNASLTYDPVLYEVQLRVPTNARSFVFSSSYFASDYPEFICSGFGDRYLVLLTSQAENNPSDGNLAIFSSNGTVYPIHSDVARLNVGLFQACQNGTVGCEGSAVSGTVTTCTSTAPLANTGFDLATSHCSASVPAGAGTNWLSISGNVVPGETITLRFILWDTGDRIQDSLVLLDSFEWRTDSTIAGALL